MALSDSSIVNRKKAPSPEKDKFYINDGESVRAAFSLDVYRSVGRPSLPDGWQVLCDCPDEYQVDGYFGSAYYVLNVEEAYGCTSVDCTIVIAHRGTANIKGDYEDIVYLLTEKDVPPQFYSGAYPFIQHVIKYADELVTSFFQSSNNIAYIGINFTGHSLGATLAEISFPYVLSNIQNLNNNT